VPYRTRRWTRKEYGRLIELGVLHEDDPIELIGGRMIVAEPQNTPHAVAIELAAETLRAALGPGWRVRVQLPIGIGDDSEPQPDIVVVRGAPRDSLRDHPATADLVVEVADSSVRLDRGPKARVYAQAEIPDYWIVNLVDRAVEIYREPGGVSGAPPMEAFTSPGPVRPSHRLRFPDGRIAVDDLLP
jgi:Uma2 family endonuclease